MFAGRYLVQVVYFYFLPFPLFLFLEINVMLCYVMLFVCGSEVNFISNMNRLDTSRSIFIRVPKQNTEHNSSYERFRIRSNNVYVCLSACVIQLFRAFEAKYVIVVDCVFSMPTVRSCSI